MATVTTAMREGVWRQIIVAAATVVARALALPMLLVLARGRPRQQS
jgi:hypothetical protein